MSDYNNAAKMLPILVPVDFSDTSRAALTYACQMADRMDRSVVVLHVVHETGDNIGYYRRHDDGTFLYPLADVGVRLLHDFISEIREQNPESQALANAREIVVTGLPQKRILEVAVQEEAGMIVMWTHSRSDLAHLLSGSIAEHVARRSGIPVTTLKAQKEILGEAGPAPLQAGAI